MPEPVGLSAAEHALVARWLHRHRAPRQLKRFTIGIQIASEEYGDLRRGNAMAMRGKERELANIGASVATGCKPCTDYHVDKAREFRASDEEIKSAISVALSVRDSARQIMENHGLSRIGVVKPTGTTQARGPTTRTEEIVSVAAAFSVNCTTNLAEHVAAARRLGVSEDEIRAVLDAAQFIKGEAAHYVGQLVELEERNLELQELLDELQRTQAQLVQSEKMAALGKLVAGMLHELNSPMGSLNAALDVTSRLTEGILRAQETGKLDNGAKRQLTKSVESLRRMSVLSKEASHRIGQILANLKSFARLDEAAVQKFDLHQTLDTTLMLMKHDFGGTVSIVKDYAEIPRMLGNPADLNQVWMNLFSNAARATGDTGTITVRTYLEERNVCVEVCDTGRGIPPERLEHLFEPRFASRGTRVKSGMGLFICSNIIGRYGGEIRVSSELGKGSTFTVVLPLDFRETALREGKPEASAEAPEARCSRISA